MNLLDHAIAKHLATKGFWHPMKFTCRYWGAWPLQGYTFEGSAYCCLWLPGCVNAWAGSWLAWRCELYFCYEKMLWASDTLDRVFIALWATLLLRLLS